VYFSPNIIRMMMSRRMRWAGHVAYMGKRRNVYKGFVGNPEGRIRLGRPRSRWEDNIKIDFREIVWSGYWINLAQVGDQWRAFVDLTVDLRAP
jgi:hypothetical protein